jgi:hypothetical protein
VSVLVVDKDSLSFEVTSRKDTQHNRNVAALPWTVSDKDEIRYLFLKINKLVLMLSDLETLYQEYASTLHWFFVLQTFYENIQ